MVTDLRDFGSLMSRWIHTRLRLSIKGGAGDEERDSQREKKQCFTSASLTKVMTKTMEAHSLLQMGSNENGKGIFWALL